MMTYRLLEMLAPEEVNLYLLMFDLSGPRK